MMRRRTDKLCVSALTVAGLVAVVVGVFGFPALLDVNQLSRDNRALTERIIREGRERRDQSCAKDEREHLSDVQGLRRTYEYLDALPRDERRLAINQLVIRLLPETEERARTDLAPDYCDEPGFGLPEPDPKLPRQRDFSWMLNQ